MTVYRPEHPRPDFKRDNWLNLNGDWDFCFNENINASPEYGSKICVPFSWSAPLSGQAIDKPGAGWYRRAVDFAPEGDLWLCFGAVDYSCEVFINGARAGEHIGGYDQFCFNITKYWREGENIIEVKAVDTDAGEQTRGKQGYGEIRGIWQTVWLECRPQAYIKKLRIYTSINGDINIEAGIYSPAEKSGMLTCNFSLDGHELAARENITLSEGYQTYKLNLRDDDPLLWSPESPNLYDGSVCLGTDAGSDLVNTYFGIREIGTMDAPGKGFKWITLNGKPVYLNGTLDQSFNPKGYFTYPSDEDMRLEAWRLKRLGLNMVRIHIKPEEPRKLYWMDKLGILVMEDMPCFWSEPNEEARKAYEQQWPRIIDRDANHPSIFSWVMFNESWGLLSGERPDRKYLPETQKWVVDVYERAVKYDSSRIIEDNSPCRYDHTRTDINTWHFYINGYELLRDHVREAVEKSYEGSAWNHIGEYRQTNVPLMNSECGLVWGVDASAGDSDLAWQYRYMLNEFRLHDKLCGFVFTEFHDVVNEFNGYYRIDDSDKDWGYQDFCRGMSLRDLHADNFIAIDGPPCRDISACSDAHIPVKLSCFGEDLAGKSADIYYELWHDGLDGRVMDQSGTIKLSDIKYGLNDAGELKVTLPDCAAVCVLSLYLKNEDGDIVSRNFTTFNVIKENSEDSGIYEIQPVLGKTGGYDIVWKGVNGDKLCCGGKGWVDYSFDIPVNGDEMHSLTLYFEASAKRVLNKDRKNFGSAPVDIDFMHGYLVDRGSFENSYWMTDESSFKSNITVYINGEEIYSSQLANDPADCRGVLSWHKQPNPRKLDEAGSYGYMQKIEIPSRILGKLKRDSGIIVRIASDEGGLAIYGRNSGRYPIGVLMRAQ